MNEHIKKLLDSQKSEWNNIVFPSREEENTIEHMDIGYNKFFQKIDNNLISYLEEENRRLWGQMKEILAYDSDERGYNKSTQEQIAHNLSVIAYIQGL